ncbi:MAG: hypothetical protein KKC79_14230, partial [Gammaproteobacteria bacterium]|nr:hypothetical protein [Gammaproteobacteria bacterium]
MGWLTPSSIRALLAATVLVTSAWAAHAACDTGLAERMHAKLHPNRVLDHDRAVCEPWRGFNDRFIVLLPMPRRSLQPGVSEYDLDVLVVQQADNGNTEHARVISRLFEPAALKDDAIRISAIRVDPSRYRLAEGMRAFGIRIVHRGSSSANPYSDETLSLYLPRGPKITKLVDQLPVTTERGEWDTRCEGEFETTRGGVSVGFTTSNGFADLVLHQTISQTFSRQ